MSKKKLIIIITAALIAVIALIIAFIFTPKEENFIPVDDEQLSYSLDEIRYTKETLPDNYLKKDFDCDKLSNKDEIEHGTDMYKVDTDNDGISDSQEIKETNTDPTKFSSRDDGVSDLDWWFSKADDFKEGWSSLDVSGYRVYLKEASDRMFSFAKVSTDAFDKLETITEAYEVRGFSGKVALELSAYNEEVHNSIAIYISNGNTITGAATTVENGMVVFEVEENDIVVAVCK